MKSLNAKRIAAVAASLVMGLAVAGQGVTFGNIPIVNNQGQPVVQIVVGHTAWPSDGVVAANIAAVIGNLALTTQNITAQVNVNVNGTGVKCVVTTPTCTLTNQQVWLGESGLSAPSGSYAFGAQIGSVINRAIQLNVASATKSLQPSSTQYSYPESNSLTITPVASPYTAYGSVPYYPATANNNAGGTNPSSGGSGFQFALNGGDNILQISSAQLASLLSNSGSNGESEYLWVTGFPVYDQAQGVNNFALIGAGGAYQVTFAKPINYRSSSNSLNINVPIQLLGTNWTVVNATPPGANLGTPVAGTTKVTNQQTVSGGQVWLASSLTPLATVYVGHNVSNSSVDGFNVQLTDLGQPNSNGVSTAAIDVYYNGALTNTTQVTAYSTQKFNVTGHVLYVHVNQTFAGLYAYQKWAKMQLYANLVQVQNNKVFNQTGDNGWYTSLLWTNTTAGTNNAWALQSLIIYNQTPTQTLLPGQSVNFIPNPTRYQLTFVGSNLGNNYDPIVINTGYSQSKQYQNLGTTGSGAGIAQTNITEPAQLLTVSSSISSAFSYAGQTNNTVTYDLTPYQLNEVGNEVTTGYATNVVLYYSGNANLGKWISTTYPLSVQVAGYSTATQPQPQTLTFNSVTQVSANVWTATQALSPQMYNITGLKLISTLPPGTLYISAQSGVSNSLTPTTNAMAYLQGLAPALIYPGSGSQGYSGMSLVSGNSVIYNQQNGQPTSNFVLTATQPSSNALATGQYFTFATNEIAVATNTLMQDNLAIGIQNTTTGVVQSSSMFQLNYSVSGTRNNATYTSTQGTQLNVKQGFVTERGSTVASITPSSVTFNLAKAVALLQFVVGPATSSSNSLSVTSNYGPYTVGQQTNIPNVTIAKVNASCTFTSTSCSITGVSNLSATPSVSQAVVSAHINTATTPLAVLDANANNASTLIVVGSAYVNTVAGQIFAANPQFATSFYNGAASGPNAVTVQAFGGNRILVAGYTANQTVTAGNQFINTLLSQASTT